MDNDAAVIERVLSGDVESFRDLVLRYEKALFLFVRNLVPDPTECEDIVQEAFLSAFANLRSFDPQRAAFSTWLYTMARNRCVNVLRKHRPHPMDPLPEAADEHTPQEAAARNEIARSLDVALHNLPIEQKTAFVLHEIQGLSYREICAIEGIRMGTLKSRLNRAKQRLRDALQQVVESPS